MALLQLPAAWASSSELNSTSTSFSAWAKVAGDTGGPTGGAVPKAGGAPGGGAAGVWAARRHAAAEAIRPMEARFRDCLRDFAMPHIVEQPSRLGYPLGRPHSWGHFPLKGTYYWRHPSVTRIE